jgi:pimeloyl-ACP methyl ester carboxylesterase
MVDRGVGFPVVLIPGLQGRWEWMEPTVEALKAGHRVITFSLQELRPKIERDGVFQAWTRALDRVLDQARERQVSLIGVSFGGPIAARYAARRPDRVTSLILASAPPPRWRLRPDDQFCISHPLLALPYFGARGLFRLTPEIMRARQSWGQRCQLGVEHARRVFKSPSDPRLMAQWMREWAAYDTADDFDRITAPTLVITGESNLDRVVPVHDSKKYLELIPGATHKVLHDTGHLGSITKPHRFAEIAGHFIYNTHAAARTPATDDPAAASSRRQHAS